MKKLFKFFYNKKPLKPKYSTFWPVSKLLDHLKSWYPIETLDLRTLTLKTIALIALSCSDRGQTIHLASIKNMCISEDKIDFIINDKIKTTRKILKPHIISCISTNSPELDVCAHVKAYLQKTESYRTENGPFQLFLSWKTHRPVTRQSLSRWLTLVLKIAGIDISKFQAHSYRGAGLSKAIRSGASIPQIVKAGHWKNASTFKTFYNAPSYDSEIGKIILSQ